MHAEPTNQLKSTSDPEQAGIATLRLSVELAKFAYVDFDRVIESLNTRSGVALGVAVAMGGLVAARIGSLLPAAVPAGALGLAAVLLSFAPIVLLAVGVANLVGAMRALEAPAPYSMEDLVTKDRLLSEEDFLAQQLVNFKRSVDGRRLLSAKKAARYGRGLTWVLFGMGLYVLTEIVLAATIPLR